MSHVRKTLLLPVAHIDTVQVLLAEVPGGANMFTTQVGVSGAASHFISSGVTTDDILTLLIGLADVYVGDSSDVLAILGMEIIPSTTPET